MRAANRAWQSMRRRSRNDDRERNATLTLTLRTDTYFAYGRNIVRGRTKREGGRWCVSPWTWWGCVRHGTAGEKSNSKKDNERSNSLQDRRRFLPPLHACISPDVVGFFFLSWDPGNGFHVDWDSCPSEPRGERLTLWTELSKKKKAELRNDGKIECFVLLIILLVNYTKHKKSFNMTRVSGKYKEKMRRNVRRQGCIAYYAWCLSMTV